MLADMQWVLSTVERGWTYSLGQYQVHLGERQLEVEIGKGSGMSLTIVLYDKPKVLIDNLVPIPTLLESAWLERYKAFRTPVP